MSSTISLYDFQNSAPQLGELDFLNMVGPDGLDVDSERETCADKIHISLSDQQGGHGYFYDVSINGDLQRHLSQEDLARMSRSGFGGCAYSNHIAEVRLQLDSKSLPSSAKGVTVFVIGEDKGSSHEQAIARTISGPLGLAQGADVQLRTTGAYGKYIDAHPATRGWGPQPPLWQYAQLGVAQLEADLHAVREEIKAVRSTVPADGRTRIVSMSWGKDIATVAGELAMRVAPGSDAWSAGVEPVEQRLRRHIDAGNPDDAAQVRRELAHQLADEMGRQLTDAVNAEKFRKLKSDLQGEVNKATNKGLVIFNAAGNDADFARRVLGNEGLSTMVTDSINGPISVGAVDLRKRTIWERSASSRIAAPGVELPVGTNNGAAMNVNGTSFAAPYAASVAALMVAANPKITPGQIKAILTSATVTTGLADGTRMIDPVAAVAEAEKLASK